MSDDFYKIHCNKKYLSRAFTSDILYFQIFWIIEVSHPAQKKKNE